MTKLKLDAEIIAEDNTNDLLLIAYDGRLYVQATPDGEPLAIFDAADVLSAIGAEQANEQSKIVALVAIATNHTVAGFGDRRTFVAAYTLLAVAEALAAARLILPSDSPTTHLAAALEIDLRGSFDHLATDHHPLLLPCNDDQLAAARAAVAVALTVAAEAENRDLLTDALAHASADISRGVTDLAGREKPSC